MLNPEDKEKLKNLINSLNYDSPLIDEIKVFLDSYDGNNVDDLNMLIFALVTFIMGVQEMEIRAEGYDALEFENAMFEEQMDELKKDFDKLSSGKLPKEPFTSRSGNSSQTPQPVTPPIQN
ncbi:hypothetical protein C4561_03250 [candidate division WWE3 bacterium]|jgi:hypothetical protein|uniref:Uncharacterized protein n=1 Tax=candidate division WWE3 bacterium TaxID=2053526 RepID=A0A3A4ZKD7_UNCKA|nr:MAG: hypothetical protein C4561_03250 [candidate division WWE3 bacterium]